MIPPGERPARITRTMRVLLLSAVVTSSAGFAMLPAAPSAALAGRTRPTHGGSLLAHDVAARISPPQAGAGSYRHAREFGRGAWTHKYLVVLGSHVSFFFAQQHERVGFGKRSVCAAGVLLCSDRA